ncbi:MAG: polysaccharide deacetylase family protein [Paludibacteraceae bacterium]
MNETVSYIIRFLLNGNDTLVERVGYTSDVACFSQFSVVVVPSDFFADGVYGTPRSEPSLPLQNMDGVPLLFGEPRMELHGQTLVVYADVVASAFYLLSRYEEWLHPHDARDVHGRFIGRKSLPGRAGFIHRPIVDEYGVLLRTWLRQVGCAVEEPSPGFSEIYLTHDVDTIAYYRHLRGFLGGIKRAIFGRETHLRDVMRAQLALNNDVAYTFPWLVAQDAQLPQAHKIYFIKSAFKSDRLDYPQYNLQGRDAQQLFAFLRENGCILGLHASYFSGAHPAYISAEKAKLQSALQMPVTTNRWHYLRTLQSTDGESLTAADITDDFTMGYADVAGFRLGTCRAVRWINPATRELSSLVLHPLTVMDCTLSNANYMNLSEGEAERYVSDLLTEVARHHGEVVLLWHNTSVVKCNEYHRNLYHKVVNLLLK